VPDPALPGKMSSAGLLLVKLRMGESTVEEADAGDEIKPTAAFRLASALLLLPLPLLLLLLLIVAAAGSPAPVRPEQPNLPCKSRSGFGACCPVAAPFPPPCC